MKKNNIVQRMFKVIKQIAISTMMLCNSLVSVNSLDCISLKNQKCKVKPEIVNIIVMILYFIILVLRHISVVVIVIILVIRMQEFVNLIF